LTRTLSLSPAVYHRIEVASAVPTISLVNAVLKSAIDDGASDIHFERQAKQMLVSSRVDGVTRELISIPKHMQGGGSRRAMHPSRHLPCRMSCPRMLCLDVEAFRLSFAQI
jgi:hypothetical protein